MDLYGVVKQFHSGFRYVVLVFVLIAIVQALLGWAGKKLYTETHRKINLITLICFHTQVLIGLLLYFLSPLVQFTSQTMKQADTRYWTIEHIGMMCLAAVWVTVGHIRSKKAVLPSAKHRAIAVYYLLALVMVIIAILASHRPLIGN